jgi:hypothetical protein
LRTVGFDVTVYSSLVKGVNMLKELTSEALLEHVQQHHPDERELELKTLEDTLAEERFRFDRYAHVLPAIRKLEAAGLGTFKVGRRTRPSRILWAKKPVDLTYGKVNGKKLDGVSPSNNNGELVEYPLPLRKGVMAKLWLPADLTSADATRASDFIKNLVV